MKKQSILNLFLLVGLAGFGNAANILAMLPFPYVSHIRNFEPFIKELAKRGHNVTLVSPFPQKSPVPNLTEIIVPNFLDKLLASTEVTNALDMNTLFFKLFGLWMFGLNGLPMALEFKEVKRLIADTDSAFDLVIAETWCLQELFVAFGHKFNAPVVNIMPTHLFPAAAYFSGNHMPTAYAPSYRFPFTDHMSFTERAMNAIFYYMDIIVANMWYLPKIDSLMREHFKYSGSKNLPYLADMLRNTSLTLMDYHPVVEYPIPLHRNVIPFGGVSLKNPDKLSTDLKKVMDNAKHGVIYVSFGSYFNVSDLSENILEGMLKALDKSKLKILMKMNDATILDKYSIKNIESRTWFPQASILAHPNCKLFITHCGIHGLMEGVYNAVPLLAVPLLADQAYNAKIIETQGIGYIIDKNTITEESFAKGIEEVLTNPMYLENIQKRSAIFKDNQVDILDNVIYWIEYVIRHRGAPHLRPAVLDLYWFQYLMLDVIAFYLIVMFVILYIIKLCIKLLVGSIKCMVCRKSCTKSNQKSKED